VLQRCKETRLVLEAFQQAWAGQLLTNGFERDAALRIGLNGQIHVAHATTADALQNAIRPDALQLVCAGRGVKRIRRGGFRGGGRQQASTALAKGPSMLRNAANSRSRVGASNRDHWLASSRALMMIRSA